MTGMCRHADEKTEAQRGEVLCLRACGQEVAELGVELRTLKRAGTFREAHAQQE